MNLLLCSRGSFERRLLTAATAAANYQCIAEEKLVIHQAVGVVSKEKEMVRTNQHEDLIWS